MPERDRLNACGKLSSLQRCGNYCNDSNRGAVKLAHEFIEGSTKHTCLQAQNACTGVRINWTLVCGSFLTLHEARFELSHLDLHFLLLLRFILTIDATNPA